LLADVELAAERGESKRRKEERDAEADFSIPD
jgi:hypothetical protein